MGREKNVNQTSDKDCVFLVHWMSYSSRRKAEAAVTRAKLLPGFSEYPDYFLINRYEINKDHWTSGFANVKVSIPVNSARNSGGWRQVPS